MKPAIAKVAYDIGCPAAGFALVIGIVWIARAYLGPPDEAPFAEIGIALAGGSILIAALLAAWKARESPHAH